MNVVLNINAINKNNIFFYESVKNTVISNSNFIRIIYSNKEIIMNGIYIKFDIDKQILQNNNNNNSNNNIFNQLEELEIYILNKYKNNKVNNNKNNNICYKIKEQILYLINKINNCNNDRVIFTYILKISGLWETDNHIGLTYKFIYL